jgi:hypothetical protein
MSPSPINEDSSREQSPASEQAEPVSDGSNEGQKKRQSAWSASCAAIEYVSHLPRKRLRYRDKNSDILLGLAILMLIPLTFVPHQWQMPLALLCDVACLFSVVWFLANRLGIIRTLTERQSVLVWDIAIGVFILSIVLCINCILMFKALFDISHVG